MTRKRTVAIIGAGISGLSCAQRLLQAGVPVRIFEKSGRPGGRCATRLWQAHLIDHGTQYFCAATPEFKKELLTKLFHFRPIVAPIVDPVGKPIPSNSGPRFYALQGNNYLGYVLARDLNIAYSVKVEKISCDGDTIRCMGEEFGAVVCCAPGTQAQELFGLERAPAEYEPCLTALFEYASLRVGTALQAYARIQTVGPIAWSACENHKAGRVIGEKTVFVVHASPEFSRDYFNEPPEVYVPLLRSIHEELWKIQERTLLASFGHRWRFSRSIKNDPVKLPPRLFICGDNRVSSDIENVWHDGRKVATDVLNSLANF